MLRQRLRAEDGFGLVELLVTLLILGVLVAIAVPSLLGQRSKAQAVNAKAMTATAAKAATSFGMERDGFDGVTPSALAKLEQSLGTAIDLTAEGTEKTFTVSVTSVAGTTFSIARAADGTLTRDCTPAGSDGCRAAADAGGNRW